MLKKMVLYSPAVTNAGSYVDAGTTIEIGTDADQVDPKMAQDYLDTARAVSLTDAKADENAPPVVEPPLEPLPGQ